MPNITEKSKIYYCVFKGCSQRSTCENTKMCGYHKQFTKDGKILDHVKHLFID